MDDENLELKFAIHELLRPSFLLALLSLEPFLGSSMLEPRARGGREG